jgi:hypothetical protein
MTRVDTNLVHHYATLETTPVVIPGCVGGETLNRAMKMRFLIPALYVAFFITALIWTFVHSGDAFGAFYRPWKLMVQDEEYDVRNQSRG